MKALKSKMKNKIAYKQIEVQKHIGYYSFTPKKVKDVLVLIHGISRNAEELVNVFSEYAEKQGVALIAPVFSKEYASDYQRLGRRGKGPRSDYQLLSILKDYKNAYQLEFQRFHLFGYSAGAQYAHRFAFGYPNLVNTVSLAAAGWYSLPTTTLPFPRGTRLRKQLPGILFEPNRYLRTKFRVFIGKEDNKRDVALNTNPKIDLTQGRNRIQRAQNWIDLMQLAMHKRSINNSIELKLLKSAGHDFMQCVENGCLHELVLEWIKEVNK